jgi:dTDP-4-dehydrorhamnose reductase
VLVSAPHDPTQRRGALVRIAAAEYGARVRVLVIGAAGQLGRELVRALPPSTTVALDHDALDVRDAAAVAARLAAELPDIVVNGTADNRVDAAEADPTGAQALNADAVGDLARAADAAGAFLVHVSTDYVFDGRARTPYAEDAAPNPLGAYARSKLEGERRCAAHAARHAIVRTAGLYAAGGSRGKGGSFVDKVLAQARRGEPLRVVDDQVTAPTWARDVAAALARLLPRWVRGDAPPGVYHVTNAGACSWHEFARAALALAGVAAEVTPVTTASFGAAAPRPAYSVLANARIAALGEPPLRSWHDALAAYLRDSGAGPGPE